MIGKWHIHVRYGRAYHFQLRVKPDGGYTQAADIIQVILHTFEIAAVTVKTPCRGLTTGHAYREFYHW